MNQGQINSGPAEAYGEFFENYSSRYEKWLNYEPEQQGEWKTRGGGD